ncbi:MAG: hypothetical protein EOO06_15520 [Chitinophagaceae bacterium]|nr:MAG: hypothetical protein EOO06_15520 [Chitinophagaceae bacterium]
MSKDKSINPADLPESNTFNEKDVNQHKHLADTGKPLDKLEKLNDDLQGKPGNRTSKEDGINQQPNDQDEDWQRQQSDV